MKIRELDSCTIKSFDLDYAVNASPPVWNMDSKRYNMWFEHIIIIRSNRLDFGP